MKKTLKYLPAVVAAVAIVVATSLSWLAIETPIDFPDSFGGSTRVSYFAGGDGSKENPYLIKTRTHMYNLAWLQYLGYFNLGGYINNGRAQSFFKIDDSVTSIDMQGLALPPIGTREYPFIGNFNGNGKVVYNFTVSNAKSELKRRPRGAQFNSNGVLTTTATVSESSTYEQVDIVGMFGVAGDFMVKNGTSATSFVSKYYTKSNTGRDLNIKNKKSATSDELYPLPDDNTTADDFFYSGMSISGFYVDKISVNSVTNKSLIGLMTGFVGCTLENAGVYRCKINIKADTATGVGDVYGSDGNLREYNTVVSKYSIVGDYDDKLVGWSENPSGDTDGGTGWGGSIDMKMLDRRLNYMFTEGDVNVTKSSSNIFNTNLTVTNTGFYWRTLDNRYSKVNTITWYAGTIIPLNVDEKSMYLDKEDENSDYDNNNSGVTVNGNAFYTNAFYKKKQAEIVDKKNNTGYMVGTDTNSPRTKMQTVSSALSNSITTTDKTYITDSNFTMYTYTYIASQNRARLYELKSASNATTKYYLKNVLNYNYYSSVRENFLKTMSGEKYVHGLKFSNYLSENPDVSSDITRLTDAYIEGSHYSDYPLKNGCLNFSIKESNSIRVIAGTYYEKYTGSVALNHALFDLYYVDRKDTGEINEIYKINTIYKSADGTITYNTDPGNGATKVFDFNVINSGDGALNKLSAYYYEIPVYAGNYLLGASSAETVNMSYLMYLDIGTNGKQDDSQPSTETLPYIMQTVDFVSMPADDASDTISVPVGGYPSYEDVGFELGFGENGSIDDEVFFRRGNYTSFGTDDISTTVYFYRKNANIAYALVPSDTTIGEENQTNASW